MASAQGVWIWDLQAIRKDYLQQLRICKAKRVYLKVFDGRSKPMFWGFQCSESIIKGFQENEIQVF